MFMTLFILYHALAYSLGYLCTLISPLWSILRLGWRCAIDATTYHPTLGRNIVVDIVMSICTLLVWSTLVGSMLPRKENLAKRAPPPHVSWNQANESMEIALKAVQRARDDFKEMEDASATAIEALWRLRKAGQDMHEIHQALVEMSDILDREAERLRQLSRTFPINSEGAR